jgi:hypothetical protein
MTIPDDLRNSATQVEALIASYNQALNERDLARSEVATLTAERNALVVERDSLLLEVAQLEAEAAPTPATTTTPTTLRFDGDWQTKFGIEAYGKDVSRTKVVSDASRGPVLEALTPANQQKGFGFYGNLNKIGWQAAEDFTYEFDVFFPTNYQFVTRTINGVSYGGGKLPGLAGLCDGYGPEHIGNGGNYSDYGYSVRMLWHRDTTLQPYFYVYSPRPSSGFGYSPARLAASGANLKVKIGQWNTIRMRVKMNTPGVSDGIFEAWLNGVKGSTVTNIQYRKAGRESMKTTHLFPGWFYGGGTNDYPTRDVTIRFDNFKKIS